MTRKAQVLIVDDDPRLSSLLQRYLSEQDLLIELAADGSQMDNKLAREHFDLIVLDLMLPGEDGLSICRRLRGQGVDTPIIMLTAKGDEIDRIIGLEIGADDYLPKPCNPRELVARIKAVLRRKPPSEPGSVAEGGHAAGQNELVCFGDKQLNLGTRELLTTNANEKQAAPQTRRLTSGEFGVLKALIENANTPLSRDQLMTLGRGRRHQAFDRSIDVQISQLRKLLEADPSEPRYIQTVWGTGYMFVPDKPE